MTDEMDWSGRTFAKLITRLPAHLPISDSYEKEYLPGRHWWSSQKEHMVAWFRELSGAGKYKRKSRGLGARHGYNHFQCAPGLLWLAEALGEDTAVVQEAAAAAGGVGRPASQCAAIRRKIPWRRIAALLEAQE
ncbi:hypothetical protein VR010_06075 [Actinomycetaceae bacterium L2_0104]